MPSVFTRHGAARAGDDYQDLWGAEILVDFLEHPERYEWIRFEADEADYLDDILACRTDHTYVARQIKFTVDSESLKYEVSWDWLLKQETGSRGSLPSLLQKWARSLSTIKRMGDVHEAALYTNRPPAEDFEPLLTPEGQIAFDTITDQRVRETICNQLDGEEEARTFFAEFRFFCNRPSPEALEDGLRRRFFTLGGNDRGWLNLMAEIRMWAKRKDLPAPEGKITIQQLRHAAQWYQLRELPQGFELPLDYVSPSLDFHEELLKTIRQRTRPCIALWGTPGVGKSTYLSYLVKALEEEEIPIVRHHYFLSMTDRSGDRSDRSIVAESIMQQIQTRFKDSVGSLANRNPDPNELSAWIEACGNHFAQQDLPLVVIVDGLDHVWRERRSTKEMNSLFSNLLPAPEGVVVIVGTQRVASEKLPRRLLENAPVGEWQQLPPLSVEGIKEWLEFRSELIDLPEDERHRNRVLVELADSFFQISHGHPLHLRYSFEALIERGQPITNRIIRSLLPCPDGNIERYYEGLWNSLPTSGQQMLHLLAACDFPWPKEGLISCLSPDPANDAPVIEAERQIAHLLRWNEMGATPYHNSLLIYIRRQSDHETYAERLRPVVLEWLVERAPDYWRWAYEWTTRADLGDTSTLRDGPNIDWTVEAIALGRPISQLVDIIQRAAWIALDEGALHRVVELNILENYLLNCFPSQVDDFGPLLFCQLKLVEDPYLERRLLDDLYDISDGELIGLAQAERERGTTKIPELCFREFLSRVEFERRSRSGASRSRDSDACTTLNFAALARDTNPERILRFARAERAYGYGLDAFGGYCRFLSRFKELDILRDFSGKDLERQEAYDLAMIIVRLACEEGFDLRLWIQAPRQFSFPLVSCYQTLKGAPPSVPLFSESPDTRILEVEEYELIGAQPRLIHFFHSVFFSSLELSLLADAEYGDMWLRAVAKKGWVGSLCNHLTMEARKLGSQIKQGELPTYSWVYQAMDSFPPPDWEEKRVAQRFRSYFTHALIEIALDLHMLGSIIGGPTQISIDEIKNVVSSVYWNREVWLERYNQNGRPILTNEALDWLLEHEQAELVRTVNQLDERFTLYVRLARIAILHGTAFTDAAKTLIRKASACLVGYRWRKDYLLFETLEILEDCQKAGIGDTEGWMFQLAPMIEGINDFTDGDETGDLRVEFANSVLAIRPDLFSAYFQNLMANNEWYYAERTMRIFLENADFNDLVTSAIGRTVVDITGLSTLTERTEAGDSGAQAVLQAQDRFLGGITNGEEWESSESDFDLKEIPEHLQPEAYPPEKLGEYIDQISKARFVYRRDVAEAWMEHWNKAGLGLEILDAVEASGDQYELLFDGTYDLLFEICLVLKGRTAAYKWLLKAHRAQHGWSWLFARGGAAEARFEKFALYYPEGWLDFVQEVAGPNNREDRIGRSPGIGFSRLVKFLLSVDQRDVAERVAESAIRISLERIADLALPIPGWISREVVPNPLLKLILDRLEWPSLMVRQRAASEIATLLRDPDLREEMGSELLRRLADERLETSSALLLIILMRLKAEGTPIFPEIEAYETALGYPSPLSHIMFSEIKEGEVPPFNWGDWHSSRVPSTFASDPYFERYKKSFVPPIYSMHAESIERNYLIPFSKQWEFEWQQILERTGLPKSGPPSYFFGSPSERRYVHIDVPQSEAYRSAYLRALSWAVDEGGLSQSQAKALALECCPVDIALWMVEPSEKPDWWPDATPSSDVIDTVPSQLWPQIDELWGRQSEGDSNKILVQASGHIAATDNLIYDLGLFSVFQKFKGGEDPSLDDLINWLEFEKTIRPERPSTTSRGRLQPGSIGHHVRNLGSWSVAPVAFRLRSWTTPRWQPGSMWRGVWVPAPYLLPYDNELVPEIEVMELHSDGRVLSQWMTWHERIQERFHNDISPGVGECLWVDQDTIGSFCKSTGTSFCWIIRLRIYHREDTYKAFEQIDDYRAFGVTRLYR